MQSKTKKMIYIALIGAMAYVLARFTKMSIFPNAPYLKLDLGEIPLFLAASLFSPGVAVCALGIKELCSLFLSGSNIWGLIADFIVFGSCLLTFTTLVKNNQSAARLLLATTLATALRVAVSLPVNIVILRLQYGTTAAGVMAQMAVIAMFNCLKTAVGGIGFSIAYPRVKHLKPQA